MARIFVDTNVLFPFSVMDLLLALSEDGVHEVLWTDDLLDEWERVIVREGRRAAESAATITSAIRQFFADSEVHRQDYEHLVDGLTGPDPDDRWHMAAAIAGGASTIVTHNAKDFPESDLRDYGIVVCDPDSYLCQLLDAVPAEVIDTVVRVAAEKRRPPRTTADLLAALAHAGVPEFATRVGEFEA